MGLSPNRPGEQNTVVGDDAGSKPGGAKQEWYEEKLTSSSPEQRREIEELRRHAPQYEASLLAYQNSALPKIFGFVIASNDFMDFLTLLGGTDLAGNPLTGLDYGLTGIAAVLPFVSGPMLRGSSDVVASLWKITKAGTDKVVVSSSFGKIYRSVSDGLWWSKDTAGHGGSAWKVYRETATGLEWYKDADEFGTFIVNKHKGNTGLFIPWKDLNGSNY
jgi:hypothetical protein